MAEKRSWLSTDPDLPEWVKRDLPVTRNTTGEVKWCAQCKEVQQTTCSACGCGSCTICGYRWSCNGESIIDIQDVAQRLGGTVVGPIPFSLKKGNLP